MGKKIVVVGGVAAGASAATKARRTDESAEIVMFERGHFVSFANCGLPYYVGGAIPKLNDLLVMPLPLFRERFRIDVRPDHEVTEIDAAGKRVAVVDAKSGQRFWERYDKLILATGGRPIKPPIPGIDLPGVHTLVNIPDAQAIKEIAGAQRGRDAVVVGAGFIGLEAIEALLALGMRVHLVEKLPQVLPPLDVEMAAEVAAHLEEQGVVLHLDSEVTAFIGDNELRGVQLRSGEVIDTTLAVVAIGVNPDLTLARQAGLRLGEAGGLVVDDHMRTSNPDIYACGDIVESRCMVTGRSMRFPLAGPANKQGRAAGANAAGGDMTFKGALGAFIVKVCEITAAKVGLAERELAVLGIEHFVSYTHGSDHAGYYPGSKRMDVKLIVAPESGRILGAQIVGPSGVDKRIDILATAMYAGLGVEDLEQLDLAYAPPYSSAKDPTIMAGFVAANIYRREVEVITCAALDNALRAGEDIQVVDVRTRAEHAQGAIPTALLVPLDKLRDRLSELDPKRRTVVYCKAGYRSYHAMKILKANGFSDVKNMSGGYDCWPFAVTDTKHM